MSESIKSQEENIEDNITQAPDQENESTTTTETVDVIKEV